VDHVKTSLQRNPHRDHVDIPYKFHQSWVDLPHEEQEFQVVSTCGLDIIKYMDAWFSIVATIRGGPYVAKDSEIAPRQTIHGIPYLFSEFEMLRLDIETLSTRIA
jgi:hypothetical protein